MRFLLFFISSFIFANSITDYKALYECVKFNNKDYIAIRSLNFNLKKALLIVDANSLKSGLILEQDAKKIHCNSTILNSRYLKLLLKIKNKNHPLQNDGITSSKNGIIITTDLCPSSKKGFEKRLYAALIKNFPNPVPVTVFITKKWIQKHQKEFEQLKKWNREKKLDITWGNHTANHIYHPKMPLNHNFVLSKEEHLSKDILDLEKELLKNGVMPSVFFRFPGLVSDSKSINLVTNLGLITIGSNSWLAKGQRVQNNSIILLHGNKNEPKGVDIFLKEIKEANISQIIDIKNIGF